MTEHKSADPKAIAVDIARELREHPERWIQGYWGRTKDHRSTRSWDPEAVCWCLGGLINKHFGHDRLVNDENGPTWSAFRALIPLSESIEDWNDREFRKVEEVIELCEAVANGY